MFIGFVTFGSGPSRAGGNCHGNRPISCQGRRVACAVKAEPDEDTAAMLEAVATCFQQLADTPAPPIDFFELPRKRLFPHYPF